MPTCNILSPSILLETWTLQEWSNLCCWEQPPYTYEAFLTGATEVYNNACLKDRVFSDYITQLYNECLSGGSSGSSSSVDTFVSAGTLNASTGIVTFTNTTGGTLDVSGFDGFASYWSANTDGSITNSGNTDIITTGDITVGAVSGTGSITATGDITANGDLYTSDYIKSTEMNNTWIYLKKDGDDQSIIMKVDNTQFFTAAKKDTAPHEINFNSDALDVDYTFKTDTNNPALKILGDTGDIGMHGIGTPEANVHIGGNLLTDSHITSAGNLNVSGSTTYIGAVSGTGSVTAVGGFVGNLTGTADTASVAATVTLTDESSDTTCFPVFSQTATGNRALETGSNLTFNSNSGLLTSSQLSSGFLIIDGTCTIDNNVIKAAGILTLITESEEIGSNYIQISSETKVGSDGTGHDFWWFGDTGHWYMQWDQSADQLNCLSNIHQELGDITFNPPNYALTATTTLTIDNSNTSNGIKIGTNVSGAPISIGHSTSETTVNDNLTVTGDIDVDGTANLDAVDIDGNVQIDGTITVGVDDTGYDVKFFGATAGSYLLWDEANNRLKYRDNVKAVFGTNNDLEIYHDATDNHIDSTSTLQIATGTSGVAVNIGHTTSETTVNDNLSVVGDFYVDKIRRKSDSDTTTKILLNDEVLKLYAGNSSNEVVNVSSGSVVVDGTLTANRRFEKSTTVNKNLAQGDIIYIGGGSTTEGDIVYMTTAGQWASAVASATTSSTPMLGIALGTDPDVDGVLLRGTYTLNHDVADNQGVPLYLSDTVVGQATVTAPASSGDVVRIIGYNIGDDDEIWFDPDKTWVELS